MCKEEDQVGNDDKVSHGVFETTYMYIPTVYTYQ